MANPAKAGDAKLRGYRACTMGRQASRAAERQRLEIAMQVRMRSGTNATAASALRRGLGACAAAALAVGAWGCTPDTMGTGPVQAPALGASTASTGNSDLLLPGQYIVQFRDDISDAPGLARRLVSQHAGELGFTYTTVIKGFSAHLPPQAVEALRRNPQVKLVEPDVLVTTQTETQSNATWGLDRLDQRALPLNSSYSYAENGAGVKVYIVDTGIRYTHTEFGGRASFGFDAFGGNGSDCHGHGTHVAGTVGGAKYGVAKGVALVAVRVLDCNGSGSASGVIAGLDWIARNGPRPGVVNMSLGGSASSSLDDAVKRLFQAGIVTAVAAGNSNADACKYSPARAPEAMTIGASDSKDVRASFSNYGACVDWFAPGVGIVSAFHTSDVATAGASGTSMAAPHAAGAAALYLQRHPGATAQQVRDGLFAQTTKARISAAQSVNNHLLYALPDQDNSWTAPPPGPPVAGFTTFCADLACTLTDQSYGTSSLSTWSWDFGDGSTSRTQNPKHTYARPGKYTVKLTVLDNLGAASTATTELTATVITVTASVRKLKNSNQIDIRWSGATGSSVEIWKSFAVAATVPNTGAYTIANAGKGSLSGSVVRVCEVGSRVCSQWVVL